MLRCVKRKTNEERERSESPAAAKSTLFKRRARSGSTDQLDSQLRNSSRPTRSLIRKKSATLSGHTTQNEGESRSSSKSKGSNVFNLSHWRTLSMGSLFSPLKRRKHEESGNATTSGFVSPSGETDQLASTSESVSHKRPQTINILSMSESQLTSEDTGQSTPTGMTGGERKDVFLDSQDYDLSRMTRAALHEKNSISDHTPTEAQSTMRSFPPPGMSGGYDNHDDQEATPKVNRQASENMKDTSNESAGDSTKKSKNKTEKSDDINPRLLRAARSGNTSKIVELLNSKVDVNGTNSSGLTALHVATKEGHLDIVRKLLERGALLDTATKKGNTALHIASLAGHTDIVRLLIEHGANVNCQSQNGFTPLYMAAQENHVDIINQLLSRSADPELATEDGFTPLAVALQQGHERAVAVLLERDTRGKTRLPALHIAAKKNDVHAARLLLNDRKVNVDHPSTSGFTPLHIAAHYGNASVTRLLIERGANVNFCAKNDITPLHVAAKWGKEDVVRELLKHGSDVNARTKDGLSALHCAARSGHAGVVKTLLKAGAHVGLKTKNDLTPLHMAAQGDHEAVARLLLSSGAKADAVSVECLTPLHVTAHCGSLKVAHVLLDSHCNVNARALNGFTSLHIACKKAHTEMIELLIKKGASLEAATETGLVPLHVAAFTGCVEATSLLLNRGADVNQATLRKENALHLVARNGQLNVAKLLIEKHIQVNAQTRDGQTPLHVAVRSRQFPIVRLLLDSGVDPNICTQGNYTPLHLAAKENSIQIVQSLLEHGAQSDPQNKKGYTPLHLAAKHGNTEVVKALLQQPNADPNVVARNGFTPLHVAAYYGQPEVLRLLVENGGDVSKVLKNGFSPLHLATKHGHTECVYALCEKHALVDAQSKSGYTPLHLAAQKGALDIADLLINKFKADPAMCATDGLTPLHVAIQEDRVTVAERLIKAGASPDCCTKVARFTPVHIAAFRGHMASLRFLLGCIPESEWAGAINSRTRMGSTALHLAAQQGHLQIVSKLLQCGANPNARNTRGWTASQLAYKQHYTNVFESLRKVTTNVSDWSIPSLTGAGPDGLSDGDPNLVTGSVTFDRLEHMGDQVNSDSEDENGDILPTPVFLRRPSGTRMSVADGDDDFLRTASCDLLYQQLEYMRTRLGYNAARSSMQSLTNGSVNGTEMESQIFLTKQKTVGNEPTANIQPEWDFYPGNIQLTRKPIKAGFLISFVVDACGCLVEAKRRADLRFFIPPNASPGPIRIICRVLRPEFSPIYPGLNDGDCLAARILELNPIQMRFGVPVIIEVPHIASLQNGEREILVMRNDTGSSWKEHPMDANDEVVREALGSVFDHFQNSAALRNRRIHRILTYDFPQYFALMARFRQEFSLIGADGGTISSTIVPRVQAVFPPGALQKRIKVGLQVHKVPHQIVTRVAGSQASVSPVISIEPRRRKFHKPITLHIPLPSSGRAGHRDENSLCLLRSLSGGTSPAFWEDITSSTAVTKTADRASFTTTFSARFWLIQGIKPTALIETASAIYRESIVPPLIGRFAVFARQPLNLAQAAELVGPVDNPATGQQTPDASLIQLRCLCLTDDNEDKTLECLERFNLLAVGPCTEIFENHTYWIHVTGSLVPITSMNSQPKLVIQPFRDNRVTFPVRVRGFEDRRPSDPCITGTVKFLHDPRIGSESSAGVNELVTTLEVSLPRPGRTVMVATTDSEILGRSELDRATLARQLSSDWKRLAPHLGFDPNEIDSISQIATAGSQKDHADLLLRMWQERALDLGDSSENALGNQLADALSKINRADVIHPSMTNIRPVVTREEMAVASGVLDKQPKISRVAQETDKLESQLAADSRAVPEPVPITAKSEPVSHESPLGSPPLAGDQTDISSFSASVIEEGKQPTEVSVSPEPLSSLSPVATSTPTAVSSPDWKEQLMDHLESVGRQLQLQPGEELLQTPLPDEPMKEIILGEITRIPERRRADRETRMFIVKQLAEEMKEDVVEPQRVSEREDEITEEQIEPTISGYKAQTGSIPESPMIIPEVASPEIETGVPQILQGQIEGDNIEVVTTVKPPPSKEEEPYEPQPISEIVRPTQLVPQRLEPWQIQAGAQPVSQEDIKDRELPVSLDRSSPSYMDKRGDAFTISLEPEAFLATSILESQKEIPEVHVPSEAVTRADGDMKEALVDIAGLVGEAASVSASDEQQLTAAEPAIDRPATHLEAAKDENLEETDELFYEFEEPPEERRRFGKAEPIMIERQILTSEPTSFPVGSAGHDVIQSSPEELRSVEEVEETLSDGTVVKSRLAAEETVQSVTCRDWEDGVGAALQSDDYVISEPEERTEVEEVEEALPDGTVITRLVTTKYIVDHVVERAVSDEIVGSTDFDGTHIWKPHSEAIDIRLH